MVRAVRHAALLVVRARAGTSVELLARDYREAGVYFVQGCWVSVEKEVYSLKRREGVMGEFAGLP